MRLIVVVLVWSLAACSESPTSSNPMEPFESLAGDWTGTHKVLGFETSFAASYTISMRDGDTLIHEFQSDFNDGFNGREELSYDTETKEYVARWTDSADPTPLETRGAYDATNRKLVMKGTGRGFTNPDTNVPYRHVTHYGDNTIRYTMVITEDGEEKEVVWIEMTRS